MIKLRNLFCFILTIVCFWYQIFGTRKLAEILQLVPETGTRFQYQFSGTSFWSVCHGHKAFRYGTLSQCISQFYMHIPHCIHMQTE